MCYVGHSNTSAKKQPLEQIWQNGVSLQVLGVNHSYSSPKAIVRITDNGYELGLKERWSWIRPIDYGRYIKTLAHSENLLANPYTNIPKFKTLSKKLLDFIRRIKSVGPQGMELAPEPSTTTSQTKPEQQKPQTRFHEVQLNAWVKVFSSDYPHSGFYRIWNRPLDIITEGMLNDISRIVATIRSRLADQF